MKNIFLMNIPLNGASSIDFNDCFTRKWLLLVVFHGESSQNRTFARYFPNAEMNYFFSSRRQTTSTSYLMFSLLSPLEFLRGNQVNLGLENETAHPRIRSRPNKFTLRHESSAGSYHRFHNLYSEYHKKIITTYIFGGSSNVKLDDKLFWRPKLCQTHFGCVVFMRSSAQT